MDDYDDDPDWEKEAEEGEAAEIKKELWSRIADAHKKTMTLRPLDVSDSRLRDTKLIVIPFAEDIQPIEFTLIDPAIGKVLVMDGCNFTEPTEGTLLGSDDENPAKLKMFSTLTYEVGGKRFTTNSNIRKITVLTPSGVDFTLWSD